MKSIVDESLSIRDLDLWVLSKAFLTDAEKYEEGLKYLKKAEKYLPFCDIGFFGSELFFEWRFKKNAEKAMHLLEQALDRTVDFHPPDIQQIFLLAENDMRKKGFTTGYKFEDITIFPSDKKLESDLWSLTNTIFEQDCLEVEDNKASGGCHYITKIKNGVRPRPFCFLDNYRILDFAKRAEEAKPKLKQKMNGFVDRLSEKIIEYGRLADTVEGIKELYSLSESSELAETWRQSWQ